MAVLIKNMEMPDCCEECHFSGMWELCDVMDDERCPMNETRPDWCLL